MTPTERPAAMSLPAGFERAVHGHAAGDDVQLLAVAVHHGLAEFEHGALVVDDGIAAAADAEVDRLVVVAEALMAAASCGPSAGDTIARSAIERMVPISSVA